MLFLEGVRLGSLGFFCGLGFRRVGEGLGGEKGRALAVGFSGVFSS